jgi:hypothetical protein
VARSSGDSPARVAGWQTWRATSPSSLPLVFGDVEGDGVPERDEYVTSGNCQ